MANPKKDEATAELKKLQRAEDGKRAMAEYEAEGLAVRAKMAKLKALRLAKEASDQSSPPPAKAPGKKKSAKKETRPPGTLSGWLKDQSDSGRRS